ncbi:MAG: hypothetical protein JWO42_2852 [Chloroflexi bacterium]|nr:hypothetical protein [Chloroflexota bacterium]
MHGPGEPRGGADGATLTIAVPLLPGQSEAWRRVVQELQESWRAEFVAAYRRWGIRRLALWLAPSRPGDLVVIQLELAEDLKDAEERFARSRQPFDRWIAERAYELHGVDLRTGVARYQAELLGLWPEPAPPAAGGPLTVPGAGMIPGSDAPAPARPKRRRRKQQECDHNSRWRP